MSQQESDDTLAGHLGHLAAGLDDVVAMITTHHDDGGDIHPAALAKAASLQTSLSDIIYALTHHDHLAMKADDVWASLSIKHQDHTDGIS